MTKQERIEQTIINLEGQVESFDLIAQLLRKGKFSDAQLQIICALSVITQELANIADNFAD